MTVIDFNDSKQLWQFSLETLRLAEQYQKTRNEFATSLKQLRLGLAKAYSEGTIKETLSEEKAYLQLTNLNPEYNEALSILIESEQQYKGLEKVIDARQAIVSLSQSIIKNQMVQTE